VLCDSANLQQLRTDNFQKTFFQFLKVAVQISENFLTHNLQPCDAASVGTVTRRWSKVRCNSPVAICRGIRTFPSFGVSLNVLGPKEDISPPGRLAYSLDVSPLKMWTTVKTDRKFELMLTRPAKAYSSSCSQTVSLSPAISSRLLWGYRSLMPSCAGFLERRKSRLGPSKSAFNAENFIRSLSMSISTGFGAIRSCNVSRSPKSPKNPQNPLFWRSRSFKVIKLGANRKPVYDFLLVINSNLGSISHRYWDTATYWPKIATFAHPLSFSALVWGDPLRIYEKALRFLKLESSRQQKVKIWWS